MMVLFRHLVPFPDVHPLKFIKFIFATGRGSLMYDPDASLFGGYGHGMAYSRWKEKAMIHINRVICSHRNDEYKEN